MKRRNFFHRSQKKRADTRRFQNPYFQPNKRKSYGRIIRAAGLFLVSIFLIVLFLKSSFLQLTKAEVNGLVTIPSTEITGLIQTFLDEPRFVFFQARNKLFFRPDRLQEYLESNYSFESFSLRVEKSVIYIDLKEKTSHLLWFTGDAAYLVDLNGNVIRALTEPELQIVLGLSAPVEAAEGESLPGPDPFTLLPIFRDTNDIEVEISGNVLTQEEVQNTFRFHNHLEAQSIPFIDTRVDRLAGKWMSVRTGQNYDILFDATGNVDAQASNLETVLRTEIPEGTELRYIDLRFGDTVYWK